MKRLLPLLFLLLPALEGKSQTIQPSRQQADSTAVQYGIVTCVPNTYPVRATYDFGWKTAGIPVYDAYGNPKTFRSEAEILNALGADGWEVITIGTVAAPDITYVTKYVLRKVTARKTNQV